MALLDRDAINEADDGNDAAVVEIDTFESIGRDVQSGSERLSTNKVPQLTQGQPTLRRVDRQRAAITR